MTSASLSAAGIPVHPHRFDAFKHRLLMINEFRKRYKHQHEVSELLYEKHDLERQIQNIKEEEKKRSYNLASFKELNGENHAFDSSSEDGRTSLSASSHYISSSFLYKENDSLFSESPSNKDLLSLSKRAQKEITSIEESSGGDT
ncbi:MAG: hypothetical protein D6797_09700 [Bdellovibrio sp.]|nr:MAG: hypothetical protein D6797_09700 [Bdellovibrio sp.]